MALGYLGWTEEQALAADVNAIVAGYDGRIHMWQTVFGGGDEPTTLSKGKGVAPSGLTPLTPKAFDAMFRGKQHLWQTPTAR